MIIWQEEIAGRRWGLYRNQLLSIGQDLVILCCDNDTVAYAMDDTYENSLSKLYEIVLSRV